MNDARTQITREEIAAFVVKLEQWAQGLPPRERALLDVLVRAASGATPDGAELSDDELATVAGGAGAQLQLQATRVFSSLLSSDIVKRGDCI